MKLDMQSHINISKYLKNLITRNMYVSLYRLFHPKIKCTPSTEMYKSNYLTHNLFSKFKYVAIHVMKEHSPRLCWGQQTYVQLYKVQSLALLSQKSGVSFVILMKYVSYSSWKSKRRLLDMLVYYGIHWFLRLMRVVLFSIQRRLWATYCFCCS